MAICDSKLCHSCKEIKSITEFYKDKRSKDGLHSYCKGCMVQYMAQYRTKNKETLIKYSAEYRTKNKEVIAVKHAEYIVEYRAKNKEAIKERDSQYRAKNKEIIKESNSQYRAKNKEAISNSKKEWYSKNKDKAITYRRNRRSKKRLAPGSHTSKDILMLRELQRHRCAICKGSVKKKYHVDHIYPLFSGGSNGKENLQILCPTCNLSKNTKDPIQFMTQRGFLL